MLDLIVLLVLFLAALRGLMRGLVDTLFSLVAWVLAFLLGKWGAVVAAPLLPVAVESPGIRYFVGFATVFLVVLIAVLLLGHAVGTVVKAVGLGPANTILGGLLGFTKGLVILTGLTLAAGLTSLPRTDFWKDARLSSALEGMAQRTLPLLPADLAKHVRFE